jgi:hypothetical protein
MERLQRLYASDAAGIIDDELIEKVGQRFYERCRDCIVVVDAAVGRRFACPACRSELDVSGAGDDRELSCACCGWASSWRDFHASWRHKELAGPPSIHEEFIASWRRARNAREKMLAIDRAIHRWHREEGAEDARGIGRPLGVNLIEGSRKQVIAFLDRLSSGPTHDRWVTVHEEVKARRRAWKSR